MAVNEQANQRNSELIHIPHHRKTHGHHIHSRRMEDIQKAVLAGEQLENAPARPKGDKNVHIQEHGGPTLMLACFLGIFVSYFIYGLLQERMYVPSENSTALILDFVWGYLTVGR